jgi:hypothetical protein
MSKTPHLCRSCGSSLSETSRFCPSCGRAANNVNQKSAKSSANPDGFLKQFWRRSIKARIFYGLWVLLNLSNLGLILSAASQPVDRFRGVCDWEGVDCDPSSQDQISQGVFNLVFWNLAFWCFRYFYKKRQLK